MAGRKKNKEEIIIVSKKDEVNQKHIEYYDKALSGLIFMLDGYLRELSVAEIDFLELPKNVIASLDFLISSIGKVQKGQRLALGLDEENFEDTAPKINILEGLSENKI